MGKGRDILLQASDQGLWSPTEAGTFSQRTQIVRGPQWRWGQRVARGPRSHGRPRGYPHFLLNFQPTKGAPHNLLSLPSLPLFSNILVVLYLWAEQSWNVRSWQDVPSWRPLRKSSPFWHRAHGASGRSCHCPGAFWRLPPWEGSRTTGSCRSPRTGQDRLRYSCSRVLTESQLRTSDFYMQGFESTGILPYQKKKNKQNQPTNKQKAPGHVVCLHSLPSGCYLELPGPGERESIPENELYYPTVVPSNFRNTFQSPPPPRLCSTASPLLFVSSEGKCYLKLSSRQTVFCIFVAQM